MANVITSQGSEARLLQLGVGQVATIEYNEYPKECEAIFKRVSDDSAYVIDVLLTGSGLASLKTEGDSVVYDGEKQDGTYTYTHKVYALGTIITMEAQMNNKRRDLIAKAGKILGRSLAQTYEQLAADVINNGYTAGTTALWDSVALFSTAHLLGKGGTFSNRFSAFTPFSQTALEDAQIAIEDFRDGANLYQNNKAVSLHIPRDLQFDVARVLKSSNEPNSANVATHNPMHQFFPKGYHVNHRFNTTTDWFIKTDADDGFTIYDRMLTKYSSDNDFSTENHYSKGMFYASYGVTNPRCAYGSGT